MITDFQTTKVYFSSWLPKTCPKLWESLHSVLLENGVDYVLLDNTADIWCRDYMPIQVKTDELVAYQYRPDYLSNPKMHQYITDTDAMVQQLVNEYQGVEIKHLDLILDGGNVVKCDDTIVMTEKVFKENPDWPEFMVIDKLEDAFGCEVMFLPWDETEEYGHSDGIIHYIGANRVLLTNYDDFSPSYFRSFKNKLERKFEVTPLEYPINKKSEHNWSYINYLHVGNLIFVPQLGIEEDSLALEQIQRALPNNFKVFGIPAIEAVRKGGALNCVSWNIDDNIPKYRASVINLISPLQKNAFTPEVIFQVLTERLPFKLSEDNWYEINSAFEYYWDVEVGLGNLFDIDSMFRSIKQQLLTKHIIFPNDKLYSIVNEIYDFIDTIPGVAIHD
jgi:agmatine/peptidylarginine deiminase